MSNLVLAEQPTEKRSAVIAPVAHARPTPKPVPMFETPWITTLLEEEARRFFQAHPEHGLFVRHYIPGELPQAREETLRDEDEALPFVVIVRRYGDIPVALPLPAKTWRGVRRMYDDVPRVFCSFLTHTKGEL